MWTIKTTDCPSDAETGNPGKGKDPEDDQAEGGGRTS